MYILLRYEQQYHFIHLYNFVSLKDATATLNDIKCVSVEDVDLCFFYSAFGVMCICYA